MRGYKRALEEKQIQPDKALALYADFTRGGRVPYGFRVFAARETCTAVVACNDLMGVGCIKACVDFGLRVPEDVSIVALDNTEYCSVRVRR